MSRFFRWWCVVLCFGSAYFLAAWCVNLLDIWTLLAIPAGIVLASALLLCNTHLQINSPHTTPLTSLTSDTVNDLVNRARDIGLHINAIRHAPVRNAMLLWNGWHQGQLAWLILYDEIYNGALTPPQAIALIYHEMGHALNRDTVWQLPFYGIGTAWLFLIARLLVTGGPLRETWPSFFVLLFLIVVAAHLVMKWILKPQEYQADLWASRLSGTSQPMIGVLEVMKQRDDAIPQKHAWYYGYTDTHPTPAERIAYLESLASIYPI